MTAHYSGGVSHDHGDWYTRAQCRTADPRLFDGDRHPGETIDARNVRLKDTRRYYCDQCPVTAECAEAAWRHNDYGTLRAGRTRMSRPNTGVPPINSHKSGPSPPGATPTARSVPSSAGTPKPSAAPGSATEYPPETPAHRPRRAS